MPEFGKTGEGRKHKKCRPQCADPEWWGIMFSIVRTDLARVSIGGSSNDNKIR